MKREEKINKIMDLIALKSSFDEKQLDSFREVLESLDNNTINKLVAGVVFAEKPFKSKKKIWRIE
jgi:hypothetical protein|tara:strand:+ start:821 stop:1015 length:195 start_codon:yes stop_codon:yes gene_type:complete